MRLYYQKLHSPVGSIYVAADQKFLRILAIGRHWDILMRNSLKAGFDPIPVKEHPVLSQTKQELDEYFAGQRTRFDIALHFVGTKFQRAAWNALLGIPYGETRSYEQQAQAIENPKAVRAIGRANGQNPISIIVPCHRVIGKSGKLTGYASGLENKKYLIELEKKSFQRARP